jgi:proteasome-associated ATPase
MSSRENQLASFLPSLLAVGEDAPPLEEKLLLTQMIRGSSREAAGRLDRALLEEVATLRLGLQQARDNQQQLRVMIESLTAPPFHPAVFLGAETDGGSPAALVAHGQGRRIVKVADGVDLDSLEVGDEVLLGPELNVVLKRSTFRAAVCGETAFFERYTPDGRLVLKSRDEELVVDAAGALRDLALKNGDQIRWDRQSWLARERIERSDGAHLFLEQTPAETLDSIGGLDHAIEQLQRSIKLHLYHPEVARKYGMRRRGAVLFVGPPGTGKTMLARGMCNWLASISPSGRARFMNIKPGSLHSMWFSESERNYREAFRVAREAGESEPEVPVVIFLDEVDSIASARHESLMRVETSIVTTLAAELDGLEARGNILVVAATNRRDALDPALLRAGRFGDSIIEVGRPRMRAARQIFDKHLPASIPYAADNENRPDPPLDPGETRSRLISQLVSQIYAPNGENELATLTFRDGKRRVVRAADLISGASIAKIASDAIERAGVREIETGESGVRLSDLLAAAAEEFSSAARVLTPANCSRYLSDLPQDVDVVRVECAERKTFRSFRYLNVA